MNKGPHPKMITVRGGGGGGVDGEHCLLASVCVLCTEINKLKFSECTVHKNCTLIFALRCNKNCENRISTNPYGRREVHVYVLFVSVRLPGQSMAMRVRSMVGLIPLFACLTLEDDVIQQLPDFKKRLTWFLKNRPDLAQQVGPVVQSR